MQSINEILEILSYRKRNDLVKLLKGSSYELNVSNSYGSKLYSLLTTVEIYSPIERHEKLVSLSGEDEEEIIRSFHVIYPVKDNEPEIVSIEFFVDPSAPLPKRQRDVRRIAEINFEYIREQISKSDEKIYTGDFEGAITNARALLESTCKYVLDEQEIDYKQGEKLHSLYKKVAKLLTMDPTAHEEKPFREVLSGCFSVVNGIANVRNIMGDAHGKSKRARYKPAERHAVLAVSISKTISDYIYASYKDRKG